MSDISFPYKKDTIKFWVVGLYGFLGPLVVIIFVEALNAKILPFQNKNGESLNLMLRRFGIYLFNSISLFIFGASIVLLLTEIGKRWIGNCYFCILNY